MTIPGVVSFCGKSSFIFFLLSWMVSFHIFCESYSEKLRKKVREAGRKERKREGLGGGGGAYLGSFFDTKLLFVADVFSGFSEVEVLLNEGHALVTQAEADGLGKASQRSAELLSPGDRIRFSVVDRQNHLEVVKNGLAGAAELTAVLSKTKIRRNKMRTNNTSVLGGKCRQVNSARILIKDTSC